MKIKTAIATLTMAIALIANPITVQAAEYTTAPVSMVLYTNTVTVLLSDADTNNIFMQFPSGLPVNVTGITSNGYFQIEINNVTYYVAGAGLQAEAPTTQDVAATASVWTQEKVYDALMYLKATKYPQGTPWGDEKRETLSYIIPEGRVCTEDGLGADAFALRVIKDIFGDGTKGDWGTADNISQLKVGDFIQYKGAKRIIASIGDKYITTATGNTEMLNQTVEGGWVDWTGKELIEDIFIHTTRNEDTWAVISREPQQITYFTAY